jgi:uncharacterized protein (DUF39 family)
MAQYTAVRDRDIYAQVVDYSQDYPQGVSNSLAEVNYEDLRSGSIMIAGREVKTAGFSSYSKAKKIAEELKSWIRNADFLLSEPVQELPGFKKD